MDNDSKITQQEEKIKPDRKDTPQLSEDFFLKLLDLPSCKSRGYCDDCGRCER